MDVSRTLWDSDTAKLVGGVGGITKSFQNIKRLSCGLFDTHVVEPRIKYKYFD